MVKVTVRLKLNAAVIVSYLPDIMFEFYQQEENLEELDERVRLKLPETYKRLRRFMGGIVHGCR